MGKIYIKFHKYNKQNYRIWSHIRYKIYDEILPEGDL